jgi:hypothetical protein
MNMVYHVLLFLLEETHVVDVYEMLIPELAFSINAE